MSGGEPTMHPQLFEILDACKSRPIVHLMLNTKGIRIARDPAFAARLASYMPGFELYLRFDGLDDLVYKELRDAKLLKTNRVDVDRHVYY